MEPISAIALSLALGPARPPGRKWSAGLSRMPTRRSRTASNSHYPKVSVEQLEKAPQSKSRRAVVEEDLANAGADKDPGWRMWRTG